MQAARHFAGRFRLIPPAYVKPFVKRVKTDVADAEAICEPVSRKTMRFVPVMPSEQQADAMNAAIARTCSKQLRHKHERTFDLTRSQPRKGFVGTA